MGRTFFGILAALSVLSLWAGGCSSGPPPYVDGGTPRALDVLSGTQIGRHYGESARLQVRYRTGDAAQTPLGSAQVRFAIFGDPGGSTLSADRATTDSDGVATVALTAGSEEASFKVEASADGAPDAEIDVTVSKQDFVDLSVALAYGGPATVGELRALLYLGTPCAMLPPKPVPDPPFRGFSIAGMPSGTISFQSLLSRDYTVVGRAEDPSGRLLATGCAEVGAGLIPPGTSATLPLPLLPVQASPVGTFALSSTLPLSPEITAPSTAPFAALVACPTSPGQNLLDQIEPKVSSALASAIETRRGPKDGSGCRPAQLAGGAPSLDAELDTLLTPAGSPGSQLAAIVTELDRIAKMVELGSTLTISAAGADRFVAEHALSSITLSNGTSDATYDLGAFGLPIIDVRDIELALQGAQLSIGAHGFTLGLPALLGRALADLSLTPRAIAPATPRGLVGAMVSAATRNGKSGCAAVEDLVCSSTGAAGCTGVIAPACTAALDALAAPLDAGFAIVPGIDLSLTGHATAADTTGDLLIDTLGPGTWATSAAAGATFSGARE